MNRSNNTWIFRTDRCISDTIFYKKGYLVREFDITNGQHEDMTHIQNPFLRNLIMDSDFVFFLAFDVGGSHYLKKYQHTLSL